MSLGDRLRRWLESGEKLTFRLAAKFVFVLVFALFAIISFAANFWLIAVVAALLAGLMLRAVLPTGRIQQVARDYWSGEAGDRWRRRFNRTIARVREVISR